MASDSLLVDPTRRFSDRVAFYARSRPQYPRDVVEFLRCRQNLTGADVIADIGSGTAILSELFLHEGFTVIGVEPNDEMRAYAEDHLKDQSRFHSVKGTAEATTLPPASVKLIVAAQAFHWFDAKAARAEFLRIIAPDGAVALIWNDRRMDTPFATAYQQIIHEFHTDHDGVAARSIQATAPETLSHFFGRDGFELTVFDNQQSLDFAGLCDRIASSSYMPLPGMEGYVDLSERLQAVFAAHAVQGHVTIPYHTNVYSGRLSLS